MGAGRRSAGRLGEAHRRHNRLVTALQRRIDADVAARGEETHPERLSMFPDRIAGDVDRQSIGLTVSLDALYGDARIPIRS